MATGLLPEGTAMARMCNLLANGFGILAVAMLVLSALAVPTQYAWAYDGGPCDDGVCPEEYACGEDNWCYPTTCANPKPQRPCDNQCMQSAPPDCPGDNLCKVNQAGRTTCTCKKYYWDVLMQWT